MTRGSATVLYKSYDSAPVRPVCGAGPLVKRVTCGVGSRAVNVRLSSDMVLSLSTSTAAKTAQCVCERTCCFYNVAFLGPALPDRLCRSRWEVQGESARA